MLTGMNLAAASPQGFLKYTTALMIKIWINSVREAADDLLKDTAANWK